MKWFVLAFVVVLATQAFGKRCDTNDECEEDQCCVKYFSWGKMAELSGLCESLQAKDQTCSFPTIGGMVREYYYDQCPCQKGLKCEFTSQFIYKGSVSGTNPKCRVEKKE